MRSFASYDVTLSGTKSDIREALFCLSDVICDQENVLAELMDKYDYEADWDDEDADDDDISPICTEDIEIWQTHDCVWIEDIEKLAIEIALNAPDLQFSFSGHIEDCSDNAGDEMDFKLIYNGKKLIKQITDWYQYIHMDDFKNYADFASKVCDLYGNPRYSEEDFEGFKQCADEWYILDGGQGEFSADATLGDPIKLKVKQL